MAPLSQRPGSVQPPYRVLFVVGGLLLVLASLMIPPMLSDLILNNDDWQVFLGSSILVSFVGLMLVLISRNAWSPQMNLREGFLLTVTSWIAISLAATTPYLVLGEGMSFADAWFETVSGLTTTGSTIMSGLDTEPPGILLWRSLTQWIGGVGIVVMALIMLPFLKIGGMQLFRMESSDRSDKVVPKARHFIGLIAITYVSLTALCAMAYAFSGMTVFDALNHALTTISTGGFSTHDASMGYFKQPAIHWIATFFMFSSSLPLILYVRLFQEADVKVFNNQQVKGFITIVATAIAFLTIWRFFSDDIPLKTALREISFNVVGIVSTTGYALGDFTQWGSFSIATFFALMFVGGCTGSTAGGTKIFRLQVMKLSLQNYLKTLMSPNRITTSLYEGHKITPEIFTSVFAFMTALLATVILFSVMIAFTGVDFLTAISASVTSVTNVGPGLGNIIGPSGNFSTLPDSVKFMLTIAMLLGRLEFFTILVVFSPSFWK